MEWSAIGELEQKSEVRYNLLEGFFWVESNFWGTNVEKGTAVRVLIE
jgi:hypothetical protein